MRLINGNEKGEREEWEASSMFHLLSELSTYLKVRCYCRDDDDDGTSLEWNLLCNSNSLQSVPFMGI